MTVGRSEQANTFEVERDLKVLSTVGWVPRVTFLHSLRAPVASKKCQRKFKSFLCVGMLALNENFTIKKTNVGIFDHNELYLSQTDRCTLKKNKKKPESYSTICWRHPENYYLKLFLEACFEQLERLLLGCVVGKLWVFKKTLSIKTDTFEQYYRIGICFKAWMYH